MTGGRIREYPEAVRGRYHWVARKEKGRVLDEFTLRRTPDSFRELTAKPPEVSFPVRTGWAGRKRVAGKRPQAMGFTFSG